MDYFQRLCRLKVNTSTGHASPHKPAMLFAVMDAIESQPTPANQIRFDETLRERFRSYFDLVRLERDKPTAYYPFFHLRREGFWHLIPKPSRKAVLDKMDTARKTRDILDNVECARLDDALFREMCDPLTRGQFREALIQTYFPSHADLLRKHIEIERHVALRERRLRALVGREQDTVQDVGDAPGPEVRDPAFRRVVVPAYDYRCAACGVRLVVEDMCLVVACHLIPWEDTQDDDPRNGMALCPNHHWALDAWLIAPSDKMEWEVSSVLDDQMEGHRSLLELSGRTVLPPLDVTFLPRPDALKYRISHLRTA